MPIQIISDQIKNLNVTSGKIAANAVTPAKADLSQVWSFTSFPQASGTPANAADLVTKSYVDSLIEGLHWKDSCRVRSASNIDISSAPAAIDSISMSANNRVLLVAQTTATENGIYVWAASGQAMTRASDASTYQELTSAATFIREGSSADQGYQQAGELSSFANQSWILFSSSSGGRQAGVALGLSSNTFNVLIDSAVLETNGSNELKIKNAGITNAMLAAGSIDNAKLANSQVTANAGSGLTGGGVTSLGGSFTLAVNNADATINVAAGGISVGSIGSSNISAGAVNTGAIGDGQVTLQKLANIGSAKLLVGAANNAAAAVAVSGDLSLANTGAFTIANNAVTTAKILDSNVTNAKLQNSAITLQAGNGIAALGAAVSLGGTKQISLNLDGSSLTAAASGLKISDLGVATAMLADNAVTGPKIGDAEVANNKLANSDLDVVAGDGLETTAQTIALGGTATISAKLDGSSLSKSAAGIKISAGGVGTAELANDSVGSAELKNNSVGASELADNAVDSAAIGANAVIIEKVGWRPYSESFSGTTALKYDLARAVNTNFFDAVKVYRNGLRMKLVASSPADNSQYTVANDGTGSVCAITIGGSSGDVNGDSLIVDYIT